eukprot:1335093-Rhodomonas_salina.2
MKRSLQLIFFALSAKTKNEKLALQQTEDSNGEGLKTASRFNTIAAFQKRLGHNEGDKWSSCTVSGSTEGRLAAVDSLQSHH